MSLTPHPWIPIRTDRLLLRDFRASDLEDVHTYGSDPEVARYMDWGPNTWEDSRGALARAILSQSDYPRLDFSLAIEHESVVAGSTGICLKDGPNRTAEIGYCLRRDLWRRGIVSEAARALIDVGFRTLGLHRIYATCDARHFASFGVMEALGMRREGLLISDREVKGEWRDTYIYAVLAKEWLRGARP